MLFSVTHMYKTNKQTNKQTNKKKEKMVAFVAWCTFVSVSTDLKDCLIYCSVTLQVFLSYFKIIYIPFMFFLDFSRDGRSIRSHGQGEYGYLLSVM